VATLDVVVVGGGLGGLACAVDLARRGHRVCVLEAQAVVGGYAANFDRGGYRFDASLHMLDAVEEEGANRPIWERLNLHKHVPTAIPPIIRREVWPAHDLVMPHGLDGWKTTLAKAFPGQADGFGRLADLAVAVQDAVVADRDARLHRTPLTQLGPPLSVLMNQTAGEVMRQYLSEHRAVAVAGSLSCYLGLGCDELGAIPFFTMLASYHRDSASYPVGGGGAVSRALAAELAEAGGQTRCNSPVFGIRCVQRTVVGVTLESGEQLDADVVVSNTSPLHTYQRLVDANQVAPRFARKLSEMTVGTSVVKVWLGLDGDIASELGLPYETFLRTSYGTTFCDGTLEDIGVVAPHQLDPGCCPEGKSVISITAGAEAGLDADAARAQLAESALRAVERRLMPGLSDRIEEKVVATPRTFHRHTWNPGGTIHGFRPTPQQSGPRRLGVTGPVARLYQVGGWTYAGSGFLPSMTSGLIAAAAIDGGAG